MISLEKKNDFGILQPVVISGERYHMKTRLFLASVSGVALLFAAVEDYAKPDRNIVVAGEETIDVANPEIQIDVASQGTLTLESPKEDVFVRVQDGGSAVLKGLRNNTSWHGKVQLWLDASEEWTLEAEKNSSGTVQTVTENGKTGAVIVRWHDRRKEQTEWLGYNDRDTSPNANGSIFPITMPYVVSNGCNGLNYVSLGPYGSSRRLPFIKKIDGVEQTSGGNGDCNANYSLNAKYVIMVFGSQNGGGNAVMSGKRGSADLFPRKTISAANVSGPSADTAIFAADRDARLDGMDIEPSKTGFNGGWQVFSFAPNKNVKVDNEYFDELITGIGWNPWGRYGGQNYAEILIFGEMPTDLEIKSAEHYLAEKWGVSTFQTENEGEVRLFGCGSASITNGAVRLGGMFSGTLSVAEDAELILTDTQVVSATPAPGMTGWYDPSRADGRLISQSQVGDVSVSRMNKLVNIAASADDDLKFDLNAFSRDPAVNNAVRGWGAEMTWCDYSTNRLLGTCNGATLRFNENINGEEHCLPVRSGFMVLDTTAGGGTPFLDTSVYSANSDVTSRYLESRHRTSPVFRVKNDASFVTNSPCWLNGVEIESGVRAYNARPELLSFSFTQNMPIRCIGAWQQTGAYTPDPSFELRHGEIIFYPEVLSDKDRKDTEAYLMAKWLGITPTGYGKPQQMTVTGAGTVRAANGMMRPKTSESFIGKLRIPGDILRFSIDATCDSPVTDEISLAAGELSTSESLTVDLYFPTRPESGEYTLISAKKWNVASVVLGDVSGPCGIVTAKYSVTRTGNTLILKVWRPGMKVIVQ